MTFPVFFLSEYRILVRDSWSCSPHRFTSMILSPRPYIRPCFQTILSVTEPLQPPFQAPFGPLCLWRHLRFSDPEVFFDSPPPFLSELFFSPPHAGFPPTSNLHFGFSSLRFRGRPKLFFSSEIFFQPVDLAPSSSFSFCF